MKLLPHETTGTKKALFDVMSKAEKILDKTLGIIFFLAVMFGITYGILTVAPIEPIKRSLPKKVYSDSLECVRCGQINRWNSVQLSDSTTVWSK